MTNHKDSKELGEMLFQTTSPPKVNKKKRARRSVHFQEQTIAKDDKKTTAVVTPAEKQAAFWSLQEMRQIRLEMGTIVRDVLIGGTSAYPRGTRGLEKSLNPLESQIRRKQLVAAVLREQRMQQREKEVDVELIAEASMGYSHCHEKAAIQQAEADRLCVFGEQHFDKQTSC
ncbi:expressed unknown protein [Seminavis robusta]|uniref:Uncharacterized protein n=1 Tax=Seminavis robusta TaxID=568900 RepID=A0A9N8DGS5_9STRA|nr:expressed unknown protein [Seminavis robusta]|eukprot:Sro112_g055660.1 n/a (172) ;mRNA; f:56240-56904